MIELLHTVERCKVFGERKLYFWFFSSLYTKLCNPPSFLSTALSIYTLMLAWRHASGCARNEKPLGSSTTLSPIDTCLDTFTFLCIFVTLCNMFAHSALTSDVVPSQP